MERCGRVSEGIDRVVQRLQERIVDGSAERDERFVDLVAKHQFAARVQQLAVRHEKTEVREDLMRLLHDVPDQHGEFVPFGVSSP